MSAIRVSNLRRTFGATEAVAGVDFDVRESEIFGLVGPDGAGKSTILRILAGILDPTAGEVEVGGHQLPREAERSKEHVGYMSQQFGLYTDLSVMENLGFYADLYGVPRGELGARAERLLDFSQLAPFRKRLAGNLSGGMKQKLGLACALIHTPRILLLDEPTNGVDPISRRDFWRILYDLLRDGVTIFVSTAYLDEAERCNRVALLHEGRIIGSGTPDQVKELLPGRTWEVVAETPRRAAQVLREQFPQAGVTLYGDRLHFTAENVPAEQVRAALESGRMAVTDVRPIRSSLEDVFVGLLANPGNRGGVSP